MYRSIIVAVFTALLITVPSASAAIQQQANVKVLPASGIGVASGKSNVSIDAYLSTRDPNSTRASRKANPVGNVLMTFPAGSGINVSATVGCQQQTKIAPSKAKAKCAKAQIGDGWALMSNLGADPLIQLSEAPPACNASDADQYSRTYENAAPTCTPRGFIWVRVRAYQGGIIKNKYNKSVIIFANDNKIAPLSFAGVITKNVLSVTLPALNGAGAQPGELPLGVVLSDFKLKITNKKYLKAGACPANKQFVVTTKVTYSKFVNESTPAPAPITITSVSPCV